MSVARGAGQNGGRLYSNITKPTAIEMEFIVDAGNANGLGIRSLKSNGYVRNVFMHTSTTPGSNNGALNPNPASGYALIQMNNNFNKFLGIVPSVISPVTGGNLTAVTAASVYVITALGSASLAQWQAKGVPQGLTPSVGMSFIAIATGTIGGSANVKLVASSGVSAVEVVGDPNQSISNSNIAANGGAYVLIQFLKPSVALGAYTPTGTVSQATLTMNSYTPAGTNDGGTPPIFTGTPATLTGTISAQTFTGAAASLTGTVALAAGAPADESVVKLSALFDGSAVTIDGL